MQTAIVVSLIKDKLSPKNAPQITDATHKETGKPDASATEYAIGVISATVPRDVHIDIEIMHPTTNKMIGINCDGKDESRK